MSPTTPIDPNRRLWITATSITGGAGLVASAVPFVASLSPSTKALALGAPVEVDLQGIRLGELRTVEWRGKPVYVLRRTPEMLDALAHHDGLLADPPSRRSEQPAYAHNIERSARPEIAVLVAVCTHLGCVPFFRPLPGAPDMGAAAPQGFYCPCHGSKFDLAGRVFKNVPAPTNLTVPRYHFTSDSTLVIGADPQS